MFLPIRKVEKMSSGLFKKSEHSGILMVGNFSGYYISWSLSISIRIPLVNCFWRIMICVICFCLQQKLINLIGEYVIRILQKIRWQRNSSRILNRILAWNFSDKCIRWLKNSSKILIRILVGNAADCILIRIPADS